MNKEFFDKLTPVSLSSNPNYSGMATSHIVAGNGIFTYTKTRIGSSLIRDVDYTFNKDLPKLQTTIEFNKELPRVPREAFETMVAFYKGIYDRFKTEAQINFYWNEHNKTSLNVENKVLNLSEIKGLKDWGNGLISYVPKQRNSVALTKVEDPIYDELRRQMLPFLETHSHNTMPAFKSGTDEQNSYSNELQFVIGKITSEKYMFFNWLTMNGHQYDNIDLDIIKQLVDLPDDFYNKDMHQLPEVPSEWYEQQIYTKFQAPRSTATYNNLSGDELAYLDYLAQNRVPDIEEDDLKQYDEDIDIAYDEPAELQKGRQEYFNRQKSQRTHQETLKSFTSSGQNEQDHSRENKINTSNAIPEAVHTSTTKNNTQTQDTDTIKTQHTKQKFSRAILSPIMKLFRKIKK